jgi:hypothetical protein
MVDQDMMPVVASLRRGRRTADDGALALLGARRFPTTRKENAP